MSDQTAIKPTFHHFNLKTTRLQELIDWYAAVVGAEVTSQGANGAWPTNDAANHRIALLAFPGFVDDPDMETRTGMHHSAFEYDSFKELNASYLRLHEQGIEPDVCIDHGMTLSYYYKRTPTGTTSNCRRTSSATGPLPRSGCAPAPISRPTRSGCSPMRQRSLRLTAAGEPFETIHRRAMAGELSPAPVAAQLPAQEHSS